MSEPTEPTQTPDEPKPAEPQAPAPPPSTLDITDEEWIAASQSCCGRKE
jgi:hypothetical protein